MVVQTPKVPEEIADAFVAIAHRVVWASVATVDRRGRPRSRVMHPLWERTGRGLVGWVTSRPTPLKVAHLGRTPYVSCSYWDPLHDVAVADCRAAWVEDEAERARAWELFRAAPPPLGHDPATIWPDGPGAADAGVLRLDPWRVRAATAAQIATGGPVPAWASTDG